MYTGFESNEDELAVQDDMRVGEQADYDDGDIQLEDLSHQDPTSGKKKTQDIEDETDVRVKPLQTTKQTV